MTNTIEEIEKLNPTELDAGLIFSGKSSGRTVQGFEEASSFTPNLDVEYLFHESSRDVVVWFMDSSDPIYLFGPSGSGKTSLIKQLAAKLNYPVFEITGHSRLEFPEMVGHLTVEEGSMEFQYGPLALAMKYGGLLLLNEIDIIDPATAAGLMEFLMVNRSASLKIQGKSSIRIPCSDLRLLPTPTVLLMKPVFIRG